MAKGNLPACMPVMLAYEGGYTADKRDPGNWTGGKVGVGKLKGTKYGVAASSYPTLDIKNLTIKDVEPIYDKNYWRPIRGDDLPFGVDLATFDFGVNSGTSRAARYLQGVLGVAADGKIGPATLKAAIMADGKRTIQKLCAKRLGFMQGLKIWDTFKRGWSRRVADVEAKAVTMHLRARGLNAANIAGELAGEADKAAVKARAQESNTATAAGGGAVAGGADAFVAGEPNWLLIAGIGIAVLIVIAVLVIKAKANRDRAAAYLTAADEVE